MYDLSGILSVPHARFTLRPPLAAAVPSYLTNLPVPLLICCLILTVLLINLHNPVLVYFKFIYQIVVFLSRPEVPLLA